MMRSHGMVRELSTDDGKADFAKKFPDLNPEFIFAFPAYNVRSTELNAIIGRSQLRRLDDNNQRRTANFMLFLRNLDPDLYRTDFETEGSCNYAFTLVLKEPDAELSDRVMATLRASGIEEDDIGFCRRLVIEHKVAAIPVSAFYAQDPVTSVVRLCFAKSEATLAAAAERLCRL